MWQSHRCSSDFLAAWKASSEAPWVGGPLATKPYDVIELGATDVTKACNNHILAVLTAKLKLKIQYPPGLSRDQPKISDFLEEMAVWTLPRDPPGGEGARNKIKNRL